MRCPECKSTKIGGVQNAAGVFSECADCAHRWQTDDYPVTMIGKMVLYRQKEIPGFGSGHPQDVGRPERDLPAVITKAYTQVVNGYRVVDLLVFESTTHPVHEVKHMDPDKDHLEAGHWRWRREA